VLGFVLRRLLHALAVVVLAATVTFVLLHLAPGDPISAMLDHPNVSADVVREWRQRYRLDRPLPEQYVYYLAAALQGDLGWSFSESRPVREVLGDALPRSVLLVGTGLVLSLAAGIALGAWQAWRPRARAPRLLGGLAVALHATPEFALGLALVTLFALRLAILPATGMSDAVLDAFATPWERLVDRARHLVLPATALALAWTAVVARHQRAALRDVAAEDFVRTARAKGATEGRVLFRHALRAAIVPTLTLMGLALPALVGGAVVTESVFAWPGMGLVATRAVSSRDYALVTGTVIAASAAVSLGSLLADLLVALADPRQRRWA
jgi:peptide/nickel transport system permease protein